MLNMHAKLYACKIVDLLTDKERNWKYFPCILEKPLCVPCEHGWQALETLFFASVPAFSGSTNISLFLDKATTAEMGPEAGLIKNPAGSATEPCPPNQGYLNANQQQTFQSAIYLNWRNYFQWLCSPQTKNSSNLLLKANRNKSRAFVWSHWLTLLS